MISESTASRPPSGWQRVTLGDVCEFLDSRRVPVNDVERSKRILGKSPDELYPYYGANGQIGWIDAFLFDEPLVLLAEDGGQFGSKDQPIAYAIRGRSWVNNHAHVLRPKPEIDFDFCRHSLGIRPDVKDLVAGSTRGKLTRAAAAKISISLPPLAEQKRIAGLLNEALARVERAQVGAEVRLEAARALSGSYLRDAFGTPQGRAWPRVRLGDVLAAPLRTGISRASAPNSSKRCLTLSAVRNGTLDLAASKPTDVSDLEAKANWVLPGAFYVVRGNGNRSLVGRGGFAPQTIESKVLYPDLLIQVLTDNEVIIPEYLRFVWDSDEVRGDLESRARTAAGIYKISQGNLAEVKLPLPSVAVQRHLAELLKEELARAKEAQAAIGEELLSIAALPAALLRRAFAAEL